MVRLHSETIQFAIVDCFVNIACSWPVVGTRLPWYKEAGKPSTPERGILRSDRSTEEFLRVIELLTRKYLVAARWLHCCSFLVSLSRTVGLKSHRSKQTSYVIAR